MSPLDSDCAGEVLPSLISAPVWSAMARLAPWAVPLSASRSGLDEGGPVKVAVAAFRAPSSQPRSSILKGVGLDLPPFFRATLEI
ncbi:hypothetical protein D3C85_1701550 [compost metagenome]